MLDRPRTLDFTADKQDIRQIEALVAGLETGFNQHDAATFDRQFSADALFVTASGKRLLGWDELYAYHKEALEGPAQGSHVRFSVLSLSFLRQDVAVVHTKQDYLPPDGGTNHGTVVMTKENGGWWICAMQHTNVVAAAPEDET